MVEKLDRGVTVVKSGSGYMVSWCLLRTENYAMGFNVYKGSTKLNDSPITDRTCTIYSLSGKSLKTRTVKKGKFDFGADFALAFDTYLVKVDKKSTSERIR